MSFHNEQIRDWAKAELHSTASGLAVRLPKGPSVLWQHSWDNPALGRNWIQYDGDPKSGHFPKNYRQVATISVERELLDITVETVGGKQAVAYLLGKNAVMVGTAVEGDLFGIDTEDDSRYAVGMRIGKGILRVLPGVESPDLGFVPVVDPLSQGPVLPIEQATTRII